jgi:acyl carrier protein
MKILKRLLNLFKEKPPSAPLSTIETALSFDSIRHHEILAYFRRLWAGEPKDGVIENQKLNFTLLNFAELVLAMCRELNLPIKDAIEFLQLSATGEPHLHGVLTETVASLAESHSEKERARMLQDGDMLSDVALQPVALDFDTVGFLVRYSAAIESWCKKDSGLPPKFPAIEPEEGLEVPPHMKGRHPDDVRLYHSHREELQNPFSHPAREVVCDFIRSHIIKRAESLGRDRDLAELKDCGIRPDSHFEGDLEMDTLDFVEAIGALEDHYDKMFQIDGDVLNNIETVNDVITEIETQFPELK